jgi:DNA-binding SARP family transcriptional activator
MEFGILGPLEVRDGGRRIAIGARKQRMLLALLLLRRGQPTSVDQLADDLWAGDPPATATKAVQVYVTQLRKVLGDGVVVTTPGGYALPVDGHELDVERFESLVADGRRLLHAGDPRASAEAIRAALALWRGPPLADFPYDGFAQAEIARLEEERLAALEARIDADLALDGGEALVPELRALVEQHPLRERLRAQLILVLYRCGRQVEALDEYRDLRRRLVDDLGLEPSPALQEL